MLRSPALEDLQLSSRARGLLWSGTDFFAGAGGSSQGLAEAGVTIRFCANHNPLALATHKLNHPGAEHRCADLSDRDTNIRGFPRTDILWASPSCVHHTPARGRKGLTLEEELRCMDPGAIDRATAFAIVEAAMIHRYPVIFVENVRRFRKWVLYDWWIDGLKRLGYQFDELVLDAADFGLAQNRYRWFGVATLPGVNIDLTLPAIEPVYAAQILDPSPGRMLNAGERLYVSAQIDTIADRGVRHLVTYRRNAKAIRADEGRLATITAGGHHHAIAELDEHGRPWYRMLTNRECARAQGFPDHYQFKGNVDEVKYQIGNAVPVNIARWLGGRAVAALDDAAGRGVLVPA